MASTTRSKLPAMHPRTFVFIGMHLTPLLLFTADFAWKWVALMVASYYFMIVGVTAGYHRYFSHRAFKTGRVFQFILAFWAEISTQKGVLWWASHHRHHHWNSDKETDVHSPSQHGFYWSHVGWILSDEWQDMDDKRVRDLSKYPEIVWISKNFLVPPVVYATALFLVGGWNALVWGYFATVIIAWHGTYTINSLSHVFGKRVYPTTDTSKNNWALALLTAGEGWHNNHHYFQRCAAQGWHWYQIDISYYVLKTFELFGIVEGVNKPPKHVIEGTIKAREAEKQRATEAAGDMVNAVFSAAEQLQLQVSELTARAEQLHADTAGQLGVKADQLRESAQAMIVRADELLAQLGDNADRAVQVTRTQLETLRANASGVATSTR